MKTRVNTHVLETTRIDSARLGPLGMIAHQMLKAGTFVGRILSDEIEVATFLLDVVDECDKTQVDIDLAKVVPLVAAREHALIRYKLRREGFALFFVSKGAGGFRVIVEGVPNDCKEENKEGERESFDSAALALNDMFIVSLIRPGLWTARAQPSGGEAMIKVEYPTLGKVPYRPGDATVIKVTEAAMSPETAAIKPGEGIVFQIERYKASVIVELREADDGKEKQRDDRKGMRRAHWSNPRHSDERS